MRARLALLLSLLALAGCRCGQDRIKQVTEEAPPANAADAGCTDPSCAPPPSCTPTAEVCNGKDDDCDGQIDEALGSLSCGVGACAKTLDACANGAAQTCTPGSPAAEICDGVDDDCDGLTDEDLMPESCGVGECQHLAPSCLDGATTSCDPLEGASAELCDGKDNDCDGTVDEDLLSNISSDRRITNDPSTSDYVYAGWNGSRFGVAWQDKRDGAAQNGEIYFVPLDASGQRLKAQDVRITFDTATSAWPALAWSGQTFGLVYSDGVTPNTDIWLQRLTEDGVKIGAPTQVSTAAGASEWPDITWDGTDYGIVWTDKRNGPAEDLYFRVIGADGSAKTNEVRVTTDPSKQQSPILKWSGTEFGLVWTDFRNGNRQIYFRRISAQGTLIGPEVRVTQTTTDAAWPDLTWDGNGWALVWQDDRDGNVEVYFARLDATGQKVGGDVRITNASGFSGYASIDWNGYQYGLSWQDERNATGLPAIYYAAVSAQGVKNGADTKISSGAGKSTFTTALWNGTTYAFAWRDDRDGNTEIYFAYVGCP